MTIIDKLEEYAFLLENDPDAVIDCKDILRAIDPSLSIHKKHQPRGTDASDFWVLKYGDPLFSTDAAFMLAAMVEPEADYDMRITEGSIEVRMRKRGPKGISAEGKSNTRPRALTAAVINYHRSKENEP